MKPVIWHGCYDSSWKGFITAESFTHPAKFSRGLIERILDHCLTKGYLHRGDVVGDCFGGIGTGGVIAAYRGLNWVGCELEPKFHKLALDNFDLHRHRLAAMALPTPRIVQGDSRQFHRVIGEVIGVVSSPPFLTARSDTTNSSGGIMKDGYQGKDRVGDRTYGNGDARTAGNIETLKEGSVAGVISSPPYDVGLGHGGGVRNLPHDSRGTGQAMSDGYPKSPGQIGALKSGTVDACITSPPYADTTRGNDTCGIDWDKAAPNKKTSGRHQAPGKSASTEYGSTTGQIGDLKSGEVSGVVTSPPWESNAEGSRKAGKFKDPTAVLKCNRGHGASDAAVLAQAARDEQKTYGDSPGQIGKENGETYWQAMDAVYRSCYQAIKPGGVLVLVVKDYVKKGKRVTLCDDTVRLIEHIGFTMIERVHAMLVKETHHNDLFNGGTTDKVSRKSFFRRLAESKGSPAIDFEEVLFARKPL